MYSWSPVGRLEAIKTNTIVFTACVKDSKSNSEEEY